VKFFGIGLLCGVGGAVFAADHRLDVIRKKRQEFFLDRLPAGPVVKSRQRGLARGPRPGMIAELDGARCEPRCLDLARGAHIVDAKVAGLRGALRKTLRKTWRKTWRPWRRKPCARNRGKDCRAPHARYLAGQIDQFTRPPQKNSRNGFSPQGWKKPRAIGGGC